MKTALSLGFALLTFIGFSKTTAEDPQAPWVLIQAKFIDIPKVAAGPLAGAPLSAPLDVARKEPGLVGTLTDPQFQAALREISQRKGVELLGTPTVTTRLGQRAMVEVKRELVYKDEAGERAVRNVGITLDLLPKLAVDDQFELNLSPQILEFEGFKSHENGWDEPIFRERIVSANVVMTTGQTVIFEMEPKTDTQTIEVEDEAGHISSKTVINTKRTLVFVTAQLVDPVTGKPLVPKQDAAAKKE